MGLVPDESLLVESGQRLIYDSPRIDEHLDAVLDNLLQRHGADAILAPDDPLAALLIHRLAARGLDVPGDVAVVGFENDIMAPHLTPKLTTLHIPVRQIVELAVEILVGGMQGSADSTVTSHTLQPDLIFREST